MKIDNRGSLPRCVVIAPTRELVSQIFIEARKLAHHSGLKICVVYGGADIRPQLMDLTTGCDILVATPGRLCDLIDRQIISMVNVELLVLDEADRMMDMGFEVTKLFVSGFYTEYNMIYSFVSLKYGKLLSKVVCHPKKIDRRSCFRPRSLMIFRFSLEISYVTMFG